MESYFNFCVQYTLKFMIKVKPWIWSILVVLISCSQSKKEPEYFNDLGEILYNVKLDDSNFKVCHEDITFPFNYGGVGLVYKGEKRELVRTIKNKFNYPETKGQDGFITIRFIINCEGKAGRFRIIESGFDLKPKKFDKDISNQILDITKKLDGWRPFERNEKTWDYQQYLVFKFRDGQLKEILP